MENSNEPESDHPWSRPAQEAHPLTGMRPERGRGDPQFPSRAHRDFLCNRRFSVGLDALTEQEKWEYYAYGYAFAYVILGRDRQNAMDESGMWYREHLARDARAAWATVSRPAFDHAKFNPFDNPKVVRDGDLDFPAQELTKAERELRGFES